MANEEAEIAQVTNINQLPRTDNITSLSKVYLTRMKNVLLKGVLVIVNRTYILYTYMYIYKL